MKCFLIPAVIFSITPLGLGQSAAQPSPGTIGATSPLGADFGQPLVNSPTGVPSQGGVGATSPLGADFGQPLGDNSQTTPAPYTDVANPAPCTSGGPGAVALSTFGGGGLSPTTGFTTSGIGAANTVSAPCNSVSSSSGVTGSLNFANSAATAPSANASTPASPVSVGLGTPDDANRNHLAEHKRPWRNRPRHKRTRYDGTRDDRPRLTAGSIRVDIANNDRAINSNPSRDIVFRRPRRGTG